MDFEDVMNEYNNVVKPAVFIMNDDSVVLFLGFVKGTEKYAIKILTAKGEVHLEATRTFFNKVMQNYGKPNLVTDSDRDLLEGYLDYKTIQQNSPEYWI